MFTEDRSAKQPLAHFFQDGDNRWREGVRRFRRGGARIAAGAALIGRGAARIGRGIGDMIAGSPAAAVVGSVVLLLWLRRRVGLFRLALDWLASAHQRFLAMLEALRRVGTAVSKPLLAVVAAASVGFAFSPLLAWVIDLMSGGDVIIDPSPGEGATGTGSGIDIDLGLLGEALARIGAAIVILALTVSAAMAAAYVLAYLAFAIYVVVQGVALGIAAAAQGLWRLLQIGGRASAVAGRTIGWVLMVIGRAIFAAVWWLARIPWWLALGVAWILGRLVRLLLPGLTAVGQGLVWLARALVAVLWWVIRLPWWIVLGAAWSFRRLARLLAAALMAVWWTLVRIVYALGAALWRLVRLPWWIVLGAAWFLEQVVRAVHKALSTVGLGLAWCVGVVARGLRSIAMGVYRAIEWRVLGLTRVIAGGVEAGAHAAAETSLRGAQAASQGAGHLARHLLSLLKIVLKLAWRLARFVWNNVFRLFALAGTIAAITFTVWAWRSMQRGEPLPRSISELAQSTVMAAAALLAATSVLAILAAIAFAVRRMPRRLVRAVGLAALVLLLLAPMPFVATAIWNSPPVRDVREALPEMLAGAALGAAEVAPAAGIALAAGLAMWGLVLLLRRIPIEAWRRAVHATLALALATAAGLGLAWLASLLPWVALIEDALAVIEAGALPALLTLGAAAAVLAVWRLLASIPLQVWRAGAVAVAAVTFLAALGYAAFLVVQLVDPSEAARVWREATGKLEVVLKRRGVDVDTGDEQEHADNGPSKDGTLSEGASLEDVAREPESERDQTTETDPEAIVLAGQRIFPIHDTQLYWRFGSAELVGDGRTRFQPAADAVAAAGVDFCGAGAVVAVGMASSEGPADFNTRLAQCRADMLATIAERHALSCPKGARPRVFTLSLGRAAAAADDPHDRRPFMLRLTEEDAARLSQERARELDLDVENHPGPWRLSERDGVPPAAGGCEVVLDLAPAEGTGAGGE